MTKELQLSCKVFSKPPNVTKYPPQEIECHIQKTIEFGGKMNKHILSPTTGWYHLTRKKQQKIWRQQGNIIIVMYCFQDVAMHKIVSKPLGATTRTFVSRQLQHDALRTPRGLLWIMKIIKDKKHNYHSRYQQPRQTLPHIMRIRHLFNK